MYINQARVFAFSANYFSGQSHYEPLLRTMPNPLDVHISIRKKPYKRDSWHRGERDVYIRLSCRIIIHWARSYNKRKSHFGQSPLRRRSLYRARALEHAAAVRAVVSLLCKLHIRSGSAPRARQSRPPTMDRSENHARLRVATVVLLYALPRPDVGRLKSLLLTSARARCGDREWSGNSAESWVTCCLSFLLSYYSSSASYKQWLHLHLADKNNKPFISQAFITHIQRGYYSREKPVEGQRKSLRAIEPEQLYTGLT